MSADVRDVVVSVRQTSGGGGKCPVTAAEDRPSAGGDVTMYRPAHGPGIGPGIGPVLDRSWTGLGLGLGLALDRPTDRPSVFATARRKRRRTL